MLFSYFLGLQMTDVELDERVAALEENGGGSNQNGKINVDSNTMFSFGQEHFFVLSQLQMLTKNKLK